MKIFLHPEQLLAMFQEELDELEKEGEFLVFRSPPHMYTKLTTAVERAITNSRPKVVS